MTASCMSAEATASFFEHHLLPARRKSLTGAEECENKVKVSDI